MEKISENENIKTKVISSLFWKFFERMGNQGIYFVISIILGRILSPEDYGIVAIINVFIILSNTIIQSGFNTSLIQKKEVDQKDFSSAFYLTLIISIIMFLIIFFAAPYIADFYNHEDISSMLRIVSISIIFAGINSIQSAKIIREMKFKKYFLNSICSIVVSGIIGIYFARLGFGAWALIYMQLTNYVVNTITFWFATRWVPSLYFSIKKVKKLFLFGKNILISSILDNVYNDFYTLTIGKRFSNSTLGCYNKGELFPKFMSTNVNGTISSVMFPALSIYQDEYTKVKNMTRRSIIISSFIVFPMMIGLASISKPLIILLLTEKWIFAVPFLKILCFSYMWYPIHTANLQAINALGRSDLFLKLEIIKKIIGLLILAISIPFGIYAMAIGKIISSLISTFVNSYPNRNILNYSYGEQIMDILPSFLLSMVMGIIIYGIQFLNLSNILIIIVQITLGFIIYFLSAYLLKLECFSYLLKTIKEFYSNKFKRSEKI